MPFARLGSQSRTQPRRGFVRATSCYGILRNRRNSQAVMLHAGVPDIEGTHAARKPRPAPRRPTILLVEADVHRPLRDRATICALCDLVVIEAVSADDARAMLVAGPAVARSAERRAARGRRQRLRAGAMGAPAPADDRSHPDRHQSTSKAQAASELVGARSRLQARQRRAGPRGEAQRHAGRAQTAPAAAAEAARDATRGASGLALGRANSSLRTLISTRRFCARPHSVALDAIGAHSPMPRGADAVVIDAELRQHLADRPGAAFGEAVVVVVRADRVGVARRCSPTCRDSAISVRREIGDTRHELVVHVGAVEIEGDVGRHAHAHFVRRDAFDRRALRGGRRHGVAHFALGAVHFGFLRQGGRELKRREKRRQARQRAWSGSPRIAPLGVSCVCVESAAGGAPSARLMPTSNNAPSMNASDEAGEVERDLAVGDRGRVHEEVRVEAVERAARQAVDRVAERPERGERGVAPAQARRAGAATRTARTRSARHCGR